MTTRNARVVSGLVLLLALLTGLVTHHLTAEEHPLDQLRDRSAEKRWRSLRERFADRREERKDRRRQDTPESSESETRTGGDAIPVAPPQDALGSNPLELIPPPVRDTRPAAILPPPLPGIPAPSAQRIDHAPEAAPVADSEMPTVPAVSTGPAVTTVPEVPAAPRTLATLETLYQELFQVETTAAASQETTDAPSGKATITADPHPGLLPKTQKQVSTSGQVPGSHTSGTPAILQGPGFIPRLPLPTDPADVPRLAQREGSGTSLVDPLSPLPEVDPFSRQPISEYQFSSLEVKEMSEIAPFPDYEPNKEVRESDPYRNLCPPPAGIVQDEFHCPEIAPLPNEDVYRRREFAHLDYAWVASNVCYYPLYFEDVNLERYGHMHRPLVQPVVSVGRFSAQFLALPYQMTMHQVAQPTYPLGHLAPGDLAAPKVYHRVPLNLQAAAVTVGIYTGWFYLIP